MVTGRSFGAKKQHEPKSMPAMNFEVEWPDGEVMMCYSPSTVIRGIIQTDVTLTVAQFLETSGHAMDMADQRVRERYGVRCAVVARQRKKILQKASQFGPDALVKVLNLSEQFE